MRFTFFPTKFYRVVEAIWFRFTDFTMHTKKCGVQRGRNRRKDLGLELVNWRTDGSYCGRLLFKIILKVFFFICEENKSWKRCTLLTRWERQKEKCVPLKVLHRRLCTDACALGTAEAAKRCAGLPSVGLTRETLAVCLLRWWSCAPSLASSRHSPAATGWTRRRPTGWSRGSSMRWCLWGRSGWKVSARGPKSGSLSDRSSVLHGTGLVVLRTWLQHPQAEGAAAVDTGLSWVIHGSVLWIH